MKTGSKTIAEQSQLIAHTVRRGLDPDEFLRASEIAAKHENLVGDVEVMAAHLSTLVRSGDVDAHELSAIALDLWERSDSWNPFARFGASGNALKDASCALDLLYAWKLADADRTVRAAVARIALKKRA